FLAVFINGLLWHVSTHACDQVALQRYFCNESAQAARRTCAVNFFCDALMSILLALVGLGLLAYYQRNIPELTPELSESMQQMLESTDNRTGSNLFADRVFPYFIAHGLPLGIAGLTLAGVFAVAQSSVDSGINSTSTVIMVDLVRRFRKQPLSSTAELRLTQLLTVVIGVLVTGIAVLATRFGRVSSIMELQMQSFNAVLGPLGAVFMIGFLVRRVNQVAVLCGGLAGVLVGLSLGFWPVLDTRLSAWLGAEKGLLGPAVSPFWIIPLSWLTTVVIALLASLFAERPRHDQVQGMTIWTVEAGRPSLS
ncbi:MAG: sodium:solute symporter family transporter, partial [Planctomycetaceae bacterium]